MKIIKRTIGIIIITQLIPLAFIVVAILKEDIAEYGYLIPYLVGWMGNAVILILFGIMRFLDWYFD